MGWRFYRIWSTDWFRNTTIEKERLLQAANEAIQKGHFSSDEKPKEENDMVFEKAVQPRHIEFPKYEIFDTYSHAALRCPTTLELIRKVVEVEGPVSEEYLLKRICYKYGREKVTSVVREWFEEDLQHVAHAGIIRRNGFLYLSSQKSYTLRVPGEKRDIKYISLEELAAGMMTFIRQNISVEKEGLYRALAGHLGFTKLGDNIVSRMDAALDLLSTVVSVEDGIVALRK